MRLFGILSLLCFFIRGDVTNERDLRLFLTVLIGLIGAKY